MLGKLAAAGSLQCQNVPKTLACQLYHVLARNEDALESDPWEGDLPELAPAGWGGIFLT